MAFNVITDDNFTRANTAVGSTANSTNVTGPATFNSPSTGAPYVDLEGNHWEISSNKLIAINEVSGSYSTGLLLRPSAEVMRDGQVAVTAVTGAATGSVVLPIARWISGVGAYAGTMYYDAVAGNWVIGIVKLGTTAGTLTSLSTDTAIPSAYSVSTPYIFTLTATGASPTTLLFTIAAASDPTTILYSKTVTDSTAALQVAGQWGVSTNYYTSGSGQSQNTFSHLTTSAYSNAPATAVTVTPTSPNVPVNGTQTFSVGLNGTLANGTSLTVNLATTIGTLSASSVTFTGTGAQPTAQTVTLTAPSSAGSGTLSGTNTGSLTNFSNVPITVSVPPLVLGGITLAQNNTGGIVVNTATALSGGTGAGYSYAIYRGTDPNFTANSGSLLATVSALPYTDTAATSGVQYFYGIIGSDGAGNTVNGVPTGLGSVALTKPLYASAKPSTNALNIVFVGDSITFGAGVANSGTVLSPTAPFFCINKLKRLLGTRNIFAANKGVSGYTTTDWAPGGTTYNGAIQASNASSAASVLNAANPNAQMAISIMLGGNDSASTFTNNGGITGGLSPSQITTKMKAIVDQILNVDWPNAKVFIHHPSWYSPNTHNSAALEQDGLSRLFSYRAAIEALIKTYASSKPGQVFLGDTYAFDYFAKNYSGGEQQAEAGANGTFYVHPAGTSGSNGNIGTQSLGEMWAAAMANDLYASVSVARSYNFS